MPPPPSVIKTDTMKKQLFSIRKIKHSKNTFNTVYSQIKMKKTKNVPLRWF